MNHERLEQAPGHTIPSRDEEPKHTPGPWLDADTLEWLHEPQRLLTNPANARLMGFAPELLAAAKEAYEHAALHTADCERVTTYEEGAIFEDDTGCTCFLSRLRAAIVKAEPR